MRCPRLVLSLSLLLLLGISHAFRSPKSSSSLVTVISRKPSPSLYGYRDSIKGIDVDEVVIGSLRQLPSPALVAITAICSTLVVFEVSKLLVQSAFLTISTVFALVMMALMTSTGSWFLILLTLLMFSTLLIPDLSSILAVDISYMVVYFTVLTLMSLSTTPAAPQRPPKIIDVSSMTKEDDPSLEEQRRLRDFDRRLKDRF